MNNRTLSFDIMRVVAIFAIVLLHFTPETKHHALNFALHISTRWAVPFFFALSGYFYAVIYFEKNEHYTHLIAKQIHKIFLYTILGIVLTNAFSIFSANDQNFIRSIATSLRQIYYALMNFEIGSGVLWFLQALLLSYIMLYCYLDFFGTRFLVTITILLLIISGLGQNHDAYAPFLPFKFPTATRNALYMGFPYLSLGFLTYRIKSDIKPHYLSVMVLTSFLLMLVEPLTLYIHGMITVKSDAYFLTPIFVSMLIMLLRKIHITHTFDGRSISTMVFVVYIIHTIVGSLVLQDRPNDSLVYPFIIFTISFSLSFIFVQIWKFLRTHYNNA